NFISPTGTTTSTYNGFSQCTVPTTGTDDIQSLAQSAVIFPNPTTNGFSLKLSDALNPNDIQALSIFNLKGQLVYQTTAFKQPMALDNFKKGVYLVKIQISGRDITQKLIVQ
ncbi:MAG: T9SS type A sorting domain-containing protein, partial [Bacteroidota bacterium]